MRTHSRAVIIGGGISGCSIAFHLAQRGWDDVLLLEKGELTSGTTFHSVGLVTQFRTSSALMQLQNYSISLYNQLKADVGDVLGWYQVGSLRLASSPTQYKNLQRNISRAKGLGLNVEMISPAEAKQIFPPMTIQNLYGAVYIPDDGWLDPNGITTELARRAKQLGAEINTGVRVTDIERDAKGRVSAVNTDHGRIETEIIVNAAGQWAPRLAEMVGVNLPMTPIMHQYLLTRALPGHALPKQTPVVRDPDNLVYVREEAGGFLIGGFEANPKAWAVNGVAWDFSQQLLPPEWDLFQELLEGAIRRVPEIESAEIVKLINGPDAITPDGHYALGPVPTVPGLWVAAGMSLNGIAGAGGVGRILAEWIVDGTPTIDVSEMNVRRFGTYLNDKAYVAEKAREIYRYYYLLRYPNDEDEWGRGKRLSPLYAKMKEYGAVFGAKNGWERVNYFDAGNPWRQAGSDQRGWGWSKPPYFERVGNEHRAAREHVALFDMTSFGKLDVRGAGACEFLQTLADNDVNKPIGSLIYTQFLNERGGIESDLTIARLGEEHFRLITGTAFLASDLGWLQQNLEGQRRSSAQKTLRGLVELNDITKELACLGLWGPNARRVLEQATHDDVSNTAFPYLTGKNLRIGDYDVWAQRVSYVGELGWELYCANQDGEKLWNVLMEAGKPFGITPAGYKALDSLRLEKCYRYWSTDITPNETPYESGQAFAVKLNKGDFIGRDALVKQKAAGIKRKLVPLAFALTGENFIYGGEAIWSKAKVVSRVRSGAYGYSIGKNIALCYLPIELAQLGSTVEIEIFGEHVPALVSPDPLYDPKGEKGTRMSNARTPQSDLLLTLGKKILQPYTRLPHARAAMLTGSVAEGVSDNYSDLDLMVYYADEIPTEDDLTRIRLENGAPERAWVIGDRAEGAIIEAYNVHGVQAQLVHSTTAAWERDIAQVLEKFDTDTPLQKAMSGTLEAITVFGAEHVDTWKKCIAVYPDGLARAMVVNHLQFFPYWAVQNQISTRDATLWHYQILMDESFQLIAILAGLNHLYFTSFQFKKSHRFFNQMRIAPENFGERLENLFVQDPAAAALSLEALVADVIALVQENMPDVDASGVKKTLGQRRAPWDLINPKEAES